MAANDVADLLLRIDATTEGLRRELKKAEVSVDGSSAKMTSTVRKLEDKFKGLAGAMGMAIKAGSVVFAAAGAVVIRNTIAQEKAIAQLEATLKSTGRYTPGLSKELQGFASELQNVTTYGDEAIISSQGLLLTFTQLGGEQFPRAQKAILDVATAMGQDLKSATLQVGKALNDPILGLTALQRSGIQFSETQKQLIKDMVAVGDTAGAQTIILQELETQFGGSAEAARNTLGGALQGLKNAFGDLLEGDTKGSGMIGTVDKVNELTDLLNSEEVKAGFKTVTDGILGAAGAALKAVSAISTLTKGIAEFFARAVSGVDPGDKKAVENRIAELNKQIEFFSKNVGPSGVAQVKRLQEELRILNGVVEFHNGVQPQASDAIEDTGESASTAAENVGRLVTANRTLIASSEQLSEITVTATRVQNDLAMVTEQTTVAVQEAAAEADPFANAWETAMERIDTAFANAWKGAFDSFNDFADGLKNAFKQLLGELAHMAITRPILVSLGLVGGSGSAVASTGSALSGVAGGASLLSTIGGGIGALGGNIVGGITGVGSALGLGSQTASLVGGLGSLGNSALGAVGMGGAGAGASFLAGAGLAGLAAFAATKIIGDLFGSDKNRIGGVGINTGTREANLWGTKRPEYQDPMRELAGILQGFSDSIGGSGSIMTISKGNKSPLQMNGVEFANVTDLVNAAMDDILDTAWELAPVVRDLAKAFEGSMEQTAAYASVMQSLWQAANQNPVRMAMRDIESASVTVMQSYRDQVSAISELVRNFDGSASAAEGLNAALAQNQQFAYQLALAIREVSGQLDSMFTNSASAIRESVMTEEERIALWKDQRRDLRQSLNGLDDVDAIRSTAEEINRLNNQIFQTLGNPTANQAEAFANYAERTNEIAQNQLDRVLREIERSQAEQNRDIRNGMLEAAAAQQQAADTMLAAAQIIASAFSAGGSEVRV